MKKILILLLTVLLVGAAIVVAMIKIRYGGGEPMPVIGTAAVWDEQVLETVADLPMPPGNIAVSSSGRVYFTYHPEARPEIKVALLHSGGAQPWPDASWQNADLNELAFQSPLSLRIDRQNRLWVLDNANHGIGTPRLLAFDADSGELIHHYDFPATIAGIGSHLNDFQVSADGRTIYIAEASIFALTPALIVYDIPSQTARRLLENHVSVKAEPYVPVVQGRRMEIFGIFSIRPGVDSIALSRDNEWLYYAAVTATKLYRVRTADLRTIELTAAELANRVEVFAEKSGSDGITTDARGRIYISDADHSAIHRIDNDGDLTTLVQSEMIRWPDGFSFGPRGWLYFTNSALHQVIGLPPSSVSDNAPYQIFRFQPNAYATAGH